MRQWATMTTDHPWRDGRVTHDPSGAPICPWCGVTTLPGVVVGDPDATFVCDEAGCPGVGQPVGDG